MEIKLWQVGGCVRDRLLGLESKDIDFTVVLSRQVSVQEGFQFMSTWLQEQGFTIFLSTEECFTIRARFPVGHRNQGMVADFVLARKEVGYEEGSRRPILELGTLLDDLERRDFTVNAIAEGEDGEIVDPFGGREDLAAGILKTPLPAEQTMLDDPLRVLRAFRFSITKGFKMDEDLQRAIANPLVWIKMQQVVSSQRIREELTKCFKHDTMTSLQMLFVLEDIMPGMVQEVLFQDGMWLKPTFEK